MGCLHTHLGGPSTAAGTRQHLIGASAARLWQGLRAPGCLSGRAERVLACQAGQSMCLPVWQGRACARLPAPHAHLAVLRIESILLTQPPTHAQPAHAPAACCLCVLTACLPDACVTAASVLLLRAGEGQDAGGRGGRRQEGSGAEGLGMPTADAGRAFTRGRAGGGGDALNRGGIEDWGGAGRPTRRSRGAGTGLGRQGLRGEAEGVADLGAATQGRGSELQGLAHPAGHAWHPQQQQQRMVGAGLECA